MNPTGKTNPKREHTVALPGAVETNAGRFPYLLLITDAGAIDAPIRVRFEAAPIGKPKRVLPARDAHNRLTYALPGGGVYVPS